MALLVIACGDDGAGAGGAGGAGGAPAAVPDVLYEALASDEALEALLAASPTENAAESATLTSPSDGATLGATPETFEWRIGPTEARGPSSRPDPVRFGLTPRRDDAEWGARALDLLLGSALLASPAHAHGPPVNGRAYYLVVEDAGGAIVHHVFTLDLRHTPSSEAWALLAAAEGPLQARVTNALFENNRILEDGGPFVGPAISFSID
jgi:hypothetical protein